MLRTLVVACSLLSISAPAQNFEVASIKPSPPMDPNRPMGGIQTPRGTGRLNAMNASVRMLIMSAYEVQDFQVSGGPRWADSELYDIVAKAEGNAARPQLMLMLRALLADRFKLVLRHETKDAPIFELVVAKGGPKLREDTESPGQRIAMTGIGKLIAQRTPLATFAGFLGRIAGCPVVDKTGLPGNYSFKLDWVPSVGEAGLRGPAPSDPAPLDTNGPSLSTAIQEQLGLRLQSAKGPVESLVIEKVEKPTEN